MSNCLCPECRGTKVHDKPPIRLPFGKDWFALPTKAGDAPESETRIYILRLGDEQ